VYLVRETKSTQNVTGLRPDERRKTECGRRHFEEGLGVNYRIVTSSDELPDGGV
jgi:restriction endonuclease